MHKRQSHRRVGLAGVFAAMFVVCAGSSVHAQYRSYGTRQYMSSPYDVRIARTPRRSMRVAMAPSVETVRPSWRPTRVSKDDTELIPPGVVDAANAETDVAEEVPAEPADDGGRQYFTPTNRRAPSRRSYTRYQDPAPDSSPQTYADSELVAPPTTAYPSNTYPSTTGPIAPMLGYSGGYTTDPGGGLWGSPCCEHRSGLWAEYLYLSARDVDVAYGAPIAGGLPAGGIGVASPDYSSGYRLGGQWSRDQCSSWGLSYTWWHDASNGSIVADPGANIRNLVSIFPVVPLTTSATSHYGIGFQYADLDYRWLLTTGAQYAINGMVGARYAHLDQDLTVTTPFTSTTSSIYFDGGGIRLGLDGERHLGTTKLSVYGKGAASFIAGRFKNTYSDSLLVGAAPLNANYAYKDHRIVPILEYELGIAWHNASGHLRLSAGYYVAAWFNSMTEPATIQAIHSFSTQAPSDTVTFDGLVAHAEYRF